MHQKRLWGLIASLAVLLAACSGGSSQPAAEAVQAVQQEEAITVAPPTEPSPTETPLPPTATEPSVSPTAAPLQPSETPDATDEPQPVDVNREPVLPIGSSADWTVTSDAIGIEGQIEVTATDQIVVRDFIFLAAEAPGVDIRLGVDDDFSDGVGVSLKDITGRTYEGRSLTLTLPDEAFDGRSFNSIGVYCFDTGDLFDYGTFDTP